MSKVATLKLDDIATIERGRFSPRPRNDPRYYGGDIPFVQTGDVSRAGTYIHEYSQTLNEDGLAVSKLFPKDTILMTIAANVGDVSILDFDSACPDSLVAFTPKEGIYNKWLFHVLSTMKRKFDSLSTQNAQKNLSLEKIKPVKIQVPSYDAQVDMASTFDAWDTAIEKTEALIDAKERQFGWLVTRLLDNKLNDLELDKYSFGDIFSPFKEVNKNNEDLEVLSVTKDGIVSQSEYFNKEVASEDKSKYLIVRKGSLVMSGLNFWMGSIDFQDIRDVGIVSPAYKTFKINNGNFDERYLRFFIRSKYMRKILMGASVQGASVVRRNLDKDMLVNSAIHLPPMQKQQEIAELLGSAEKEITLLKKLADQYRTQKRGLMQKLLSGEWYIKNKEAA